MLPFKPIFLGQKTSPYPRATISQKCIRTNNIENVGCIAHHHTFFDILGNEDFNKKIVMDNSKIQLINSLGQQNAQQVLDEIRIHIETKALNAFQEVENLASNYRIIMLGEAHDYPGRVFAADLVIAAAKAGVNCLMIEVNSHEQSRIDEFLIDGEFSKLPISAGGGDEIPMQFQQPYIEMLLAARNQGMEIFAIDTSNSLRDIFMAKTIIRLMQQDPQRRCAVVLGLMHLALRSISNAVPETTCATLLVEEFGNQVVRIGRAVPNSSTGYGIWAALTDVDSPLLLKMKNSPFENLPDRLYGWSMVGIDFDYLFFYPQLDVLKDELST